MRKRHSLIALALALALAACCPSYSDRQVAALNASNDQLNRVIGTRMAELDSMSKQCLTDIKAYAAHPVPPILKSCLDFGVLLKQGVKDVRLQEQCLSDLRHEIPSCRKYDDANNAFIQMLQDRRDDMRARGW